MENEKINLKLSNNEFIEVESETIDQTASHLIDLNNMNLNPFDNLNSLPEEFEKNSKLSAPSFNNFHSLSFEFNGKLLSMSLSRYSNMLFIIITQNGKLGSFFLGEKEENIGDCYLEEEEELLINTQCILGNRKDEVNFFLCETIINRIFKAISGKLEKITRIMISTALKYEELIDKNNENEDLLATQDFKRFMDILLLKILEILKEVFNNSK